VKSLGILSSACCGTHVQNVYDQGAEDVNTVPTRFPCNKWFNDECKMLKTCANNYANTHNISISPFSETYHRLELEYNRVRQNAKRQHRDSVRLKLDNFHSDRPDAYWKLWKSLNPPPVNNSTLSLNQFDNYCRDQVLPPPTDYFDNIHMSEIQNFVGIF
jgi:hypothetical protein